MWCWHDGFLTTLLVFGLVQHLLHALNTDVYDLTWERLETVIHSSFRNLKNDWVWGTWMASRQVQHGTPLVHLVVRACTMPCSGWNKKASNNRRAYSSRTVWARPNHTGAVIRVRFILNSCMFRLYSTCRLNTPQGWFRTSQQNWSWLVYLKVVTSAGYPVFHVNPHRLGVTAQAWNSPNYA